VSPDISSRSESLSTQDSILLRGKLKEFVDRAQKPFSTMWGLLHITIIIICVVLIRHTVRVSMHSRFLRCLAYSYIVTGCFYIGEVALPYFVAYLGITLPQTDITELKESVIKLMQVDYMWDTIDSMLSIFSSFWMLAAWRLLQRYPKESIDRHFYTVLHTLLLALVGPALVGVLLLQNPDPFQPSPRIPLFLVIDTLSAGVAIILFGFQLWRKMRPAEGKLLHHWTLLSVPILVSFILWGTAQPFYIIFKGFPLSHWYFGSLLILKLLCGLLSVIAASVALKEHPRFQT